MPRIAIKDFQLANPIYKGATVTFWTVVNGAKTAVKATLYAATTGVAQLSNPQKLDSHGKFRQAVYIESPVIGTVEGLTVPTHDTGIISPAPTFRVNSSTGEVQYSFDGGASWNSTGDYFFRDRGPWAAATIYERNDMATFSGTRYLALSDHISTSDFTADLAVPRWIAFSAQPSVDTIAALKALAGANLSGNVQVLGYYAAGDHGGGVFRWNSTDVTADNGGTVIAPNAGGTGRWNRVFDGTVTLKQFGAKGDGVQNDVAYINAAITYCVAASVKMRGTPGNYLCGSSIVVDAGLTWESDGLLARYIRGFATAEALVRPADFSVKENNVTIRGGSFGADSSSNTGRMFNLYGDWLTMEEVMVDGAYGTGGGFVIGGDHVRLRGCKMRNAEAVVGVAGIRFFGGTDYIATDCDIESGDDSLQLVPIAPGNTNGNQSIRRAYYINCRGKSHAARFIAVGLVDPNVVLGMTATITDWGFIGCAGRGGNRAAVIENIDSTGVIARGAFKSVDLSMAGQTTSSNAEVLVTAEAGTGGVEDFEWDGGSIMDIAKSSFTVTGNSLCRRIRVNKVTLDKPTTSGQANVVLNGADFVTIEKSTVKGADGASCVSVGASSNCEEVSVLNNDFFDIENTRYGVAFADVTGGRVNGNTFTEESGQVTARAINIGASSSRITVTENDVARLSIAEQTRIVVANGAADVRIRDNPGYNFEEGVVTTAVGNVAGGTDNLQTYTLRGGTLCEDGKGVLVVHSGTGANNSNPKQLRALFGAAVVVDVALTVSVLQSWHIEYRVFRTGSNTQDFFGFYTYQGAAGVTVTVPIRGTAAETDAGNVTIKTDATVTDGGGGINNNDVVCEGTYVGFIN